MSLLQVDRVGQIKVDSRCYPYAMADHFIRRIRANRKMVSDAAAELPVLVYEAMKAGHTWNELSEELSVGKARIYQLRAEGERRVSR